MPLPSRRSLLPLSVAALAAGLSAPALADDAAAVAEAGDAGDAWDTGDSGENRDIIVTGEVEGYRTVSTTSGTKTDTPILDVPQSIAVVTADQIADQQIRSMADLTRLTPGVVAGQGEGHRDQVTIRGNASTADFFIDGLRDDVQYFRSFYNIDRVEVHRGPQAMIFGRGGGGGIINRITKGPQLGDTLHNVTLSADSFGAAYGAIDSNVALGDRAAIRVNGFYERLDNHRQAFGGDRYAINPVVGFETASGLRVQLGYEYVRDDRMIDRGIPSAFTGSITAPAGPLAGVRDTLFGDADVNRSELEAHIATFRAQMPLADNLTASVQALYGHYDKIYTNAYAATAVRTATSGPLTGQQVVGIEAYRDPTRRENLILQGNLEWRGSTGGIDHILLFGAEYTWQDTANERINGFFNPTVLTAANRRVDVALTAPSTTPPIYFVAGAAGAGNRAIDGVVEQWSLYAQDQMALSDALTLIAGIRYDRFDNRVTNRFTGGAVSRTDTLWSPRAGLVFKPADNASLYISYSRSYLPQSGDQFVSLDATSAALEPERFDNYEVGAKWDIAPGLNTSVAIFRLDRTNTRAAGATPGTVVLTGEQRSHGVEFGLVGQVTPAWQIAVGYANIDGEIRETTSAAPAGRQLAQLPRHQFTLWNRYDVSDALGFGLGLFRQSAQFTTISNVTRLPGYTRVDAAVFYNLTDRLSVQINAENLFNVRYFPNAHNDNNISTGAPRSIRLTLRADF